MKAGPRITLTDTQQELTPPYSGLRTLVHVWVLNSSGATIYLNAWSGSGTSRLAADRTGGPWPVPDGFAAPVITDSAARAGAVLSASTNADGTGTPGGAVEAVPHWSV